MLEKKDHLSKVVPIQVFHWPLSSVVLVNYTVLKQPVPYFSIFHPHLEGGLQAFWSKYPHFHSIFLVSK
jgi:hypothetical protein